MNITVMLGFANVATADRTLSELEKTWDGAAPLYIVDNCYPGTPAEFWIHWADRLGGKVLSPGKNIGLHHGLNFAIKETGATKMIGVDPDTWPVTKGWDTALLSALELPSVGWASLWNEHSAGEMRQRGYTESTEGGMKLWTTKAPVVNSICAFNLDWVREAGGFTEPSEFYGGLECAMWARLVPKKRRWVWLCDFLEGKFDTMLEDTEYKRYKWAHAHEGWHGSFGDWLLR